MKSLPGWVRVVQKIDSFFDKLSKLCFVLAAAGTVAALMGKSPVGMAGFGAVMAVIGIFVARLVFYAVQLSVGLSF